MSFFFFFVVVVVGLSVGERSPAGRWWKAGTVLRGYGAGFLNTIYIICTPSRMCC